MKGYRNSINTKWDSETVCCRYPCISLRTRWTGRRGRMFEREPEYRLPPLEQVSLPRMLIYNWQCLSPRPSPASHASPNSLQWFFTSQFKNALEHFPGDHGSSKSSSLISEATGSFPPVQMTNAWSFWHDLLATKKIHLPKDLTNQTLNSKHWNSSHANTCSMLIPAEWPKSKNGKTFRNKPWISKRGRC